MRAPKYVSEKIQLDKCNFLRYLGANSDRRECAAMDHLKTWNTRFADASARLDLWDTNRVDSYGKNVLRYALAIVPDQGLCVYIFEGSDYRPGVGTVIDSDRSAGGLLAFFAYYGESIHYSGDDADVPDFTPRQRELLDTYAENLGMWSLDLEKDEDDPDDEHLDDELGDA